MKLTKSELQKIIAEETVLVLEASRGEALLSLGKTVYNAIVLGLKKVRTLFSSREGQAIVDAVEETVPGAKEVLEQAIQGNQKVLLDDKMEMILDSLDELAATAEEAGSMATELRKARKALIKASKKVKFSLRRKDYNSALAQLKKKGKLDIVDKDEREAFLQVIENFESAVEKAQMAGTRTISSNDVLSDVAPEAVESVVDKFERLAKPAMEKSTADAALIGGIGEALTVGGAVLGVVKVLSSITGTATTVRAVADDDFITFEEIEKPGQQDMSDLLSQDVTTYKRPSVKSRPAKPEQQAQRVGGIAPKDGESKIDFVRRAGFTTGTNEEAIDAFNKVYPDYGEEDAEAGIPLPQRSLREGFDKEDLDEPLLKTPVTPEIEDDAPEYKDPVPVVGLEDEGFTVEVPKGPGPFPPIYRKNGRKVSKNLVDAVYKKLYLAPLPALEDEGYTRLMMPAGQKERYFDPDGQEVSEEEITRLIATAEEDKEAIRQAALRSFERGKEQDLRRGKGLRQVATTLDDVAKGKVMLPGQTGDGIKAMQKMIAAFFNEKGKNILPKYGADGKYGRETRNAVTVLQRDVLGFTGKDIDGKYGPKTHKALKAYKEASAKLPISVSPEIEGPPSLVNESILNRWKKIIKG